MQFLRECAAALDAGVPADEVLARMRERYTTPRCMNVKTCLVRQLCTPTAEYIAALADGGGVPHRLPPNAYALRVPRDELRACKRAATRSALEKNRVCAAVDGRALLAAARATVARPADAAVLDLALALMLVTGRRTCEVLNGSAHLVVAGAHHVHFTGQAKRRRPRPDGTTTPGYSVPTLAPAADVVDAFAALRAAQGGAVLANAPTSARYQSALRQRLRAREPWRAVGKVHGLRGVYACMALRLFDWAEPGASDAFVAMCILGHRGLHESLVYTPFRLGAAFADEPRLGPGTFTPPPPPPPPEAACDDPP